MRHKYKAWDKKTRTMRDVLQIDFQNELIVIKPRDDEYFETRTFDGAVLLPYTGKDDVHGFGVFESHIVTYTNEQGVVKTGYIVYSEDTARYGCVSGIQRDYSWMFADDLKIIGNRFENPNLL